MLKLGGPQVGVLPIFGWQRRWEKPPSPAVPAVEVAAFEDEGTSQEPLELQTVRRSHSRDEPAQSGERWIGWQTEAERFDIARCVVDGFRTRTSGAGSPEIYLRHATALILQEEDTHCVASTRHHLVGVAVGKRGALR